MARPIRSEYVGGKFIDCIIHVSVELSVLEIPKSQRTRPDKHKAVSPHHRGGGEDYNESSYTTHWRLPCHFIAESIYIQTIILSV